MNYLDFEQDLLRKFEDSGLTQAQVADRYKIDQSFLSRLLRGKNKVLSPSLVKLWPFVYGAEFPNMPERKEPVE